MKIFFWSVGDLFGSQKAPERTPGYTLKYYIDQKDTLTIITNHPNNKKYEKYGCRVLCVPRVIPRFFGRLANFLNNAVFFPIFAGVVGLREMLLRRPDVFYLYEVHGVLAGFFPSLVSRVPRIHRFQGTYFVTPLLNGPRWKAWLRKPDSIIALRLPASLTIMLDDGTRGLEVLKWLRRVSLGNVRFWRNGVSVGTPSRGFSTPIPKTSRFRLMTLCRLVPFKGLEKALEILHTLEARRPGKFELVIVGKGPEELKLRKLLKEWALEQSVIFVGEIAHAEVGKYLQTADCFLSLYDISNVGNPLIEAMWIGVPVLTLDEGATREIVKDQVDGILLRDFSAMTAADRIQELESDPKLRATLTTNGSNKIRKVFDSWDERLKRERDEVLNIVKIHGR
jgi:glycosyltransferase involved in cell wall biosynthesis